MTLNQAARTLTAVLTVAGSVGFVMTGSIQLAMLLLVAPWPSLWAEKSERRTWSLGEVLRGKRDEEHPVAGALDDALRGPLPVRPVRDDAYFVPGVPRLDAPRLRHRWGTDGRPVSTARAFWTRRCSDAQLERPDRASASAPPPTSTPLR